MNFMSNYILKILLKHPIGRTEQDNRTLVDYISSVIRCNENWKKELDYFHKVDELFDKHYQNV